MAQVKVFPDGSVEVALATQEIGGGQATVAAVVVSQMFKDIPYEKIKVVWGRSTLPPSDTCAGSVATRSIVSRVVPAVQAVTKKLLAIVATEWGVDPSQVKFESGGAIVGPDGSGKRVTWTEAASKISGVLVSLAEPTGREPVDHGVAVEDHARDWV